MDPNQQILLTQKENTPQQSINKIPKSGNKFKWILLIFIFLIIISGICYFFTLKQNRANPSKSLDDSIALAIEQLNSNSTSNWKTATNKGLGFSVKFPPNLTIKDRTTTGYDYNLEFIQSNGIHEFDIFVVPSYRLNKNIEYDILPEDVLNAFSVLNKLYELKIGETKTLSGINDKRTFKRLADVKTQSLTGLTINIDSINNEQNQRLVFFQYNMDTYILKKDYRSTDELSIFQKSLSTFDFTYYSSTKTFMDAYATKYPQPTSQPIPPGLEDTLFSIYNQSLLKSEETWLKHNIFHDQSVPRFDFMLEKYYGDVTEGEIRFAKEPGGGGGGAEWTMNKINDKWKVMFFGLQESPSCENIQSVLDDLRDWQGLCYSTDSKLIDGKHPNESYNNY
jgi:hypothetical protein